jgi:hypothetical protein
MTDIGSETGTDIRGKEGERDKNEPVVWKLRISLTF